MRSPGVGNGTAGVLTSDGLLTLSLLLAVEVFEASNPSDMCREEDEFTCGYWKEDFEGMWLNIDWVRCKWYW